MPARFDYGEYLHMVSIDYLLEIAEADWVAWGATFVVFCILGSIIFVIEHVSQVDFSDTHGMIQVATYVMIGLGWLLALCYWLCSYFLNRAKKFALQNIGCEDTRKLLVQLSLVLNDDGSKTQREDGTEVSKVWPRGWSTEGAFDNGATDSATLLDKGIDLSYETFFTRNVLRLLASFMLCSNVYFAMMASSSYSILCCSYNCSYAGVHLWPSCIFSV